MNEKELLIGSVVTVGYGRGFVVNGKYDRLIITAAHCLYRGGEPYLPPAHAAMGTEDKTYEKLLAPLGAEPTIWAELLFANPVADIAVLGSPDDQELFNEANAYETLVESVTPFSIGDASDFEQIEEKIGGVVYKTDAVGKGWMLSLEREWFQCTLQFVPWVDGPLWVTGGDQPIKGGMSGSPIILDDGSAVGVVCIGTLKALTSNDDLDASNEGGPNAKLVRDLPGWLLHAQHGEVGLAETQSDQLIGKKKAAPPLTRKKRRANSRRKPTPTRKL
jgi:hypothetical protein